MKRLSQFDVFRAGMIGGTPLGDYLETIGATDHRAAKRAADERYRGKATVVVLPAGKHQPPADTRLTITDRRGAAVTRRDSRPRGAPPRSTAPRNRR